MIVFVVYGFCYHYNQHLSTIMVGCHTMVCWISCDYVKQLVKTITVTVNSTCRPSLLYLHITKSYVRTATFSTLKMVANLTHILNFKDSVRKEFELFKTFLLSVLTMVDTKIVSTLQKN